MNKCIDLLILSTHVANVLMEWWEFYVVTKFVVGALTKGLYTELQRLKFIIDILIFPLVVVFK